MFSTDKKLSKGLGRITSLVIFSFLLSTVAQAEDLKFTLINKTKSVINAFYASPRGTNDWENDILTTDALAPSESIEITIADGRDVCTYDMRFEFQGKELETLEDTQNLCDLGEYSVEE